MLLAQLVLLVLPVLAIKVLLVQQGLRVLQVQMALLVLQDRKVTLAQMEVLALLVLLVQVLLVHRESPEQKALPVRLVLMVLLVQLD